MKGTIVFHGDRGTSQSPHTSKAVVNGVTALAALETLAGVLGGYSLCNVGRQSAVDFAAGTPSAPVANANVDERAIIYMRDTANDTVVSVTIPAWDETTYPLEASSEGDRIAAADVTAITAAVATATGKTLVGLWGKHIKRT